MCKISCLCYIFLSRLFCNNIWGILCVYQSQVTNICTIKTPTTLKITTGTEWNYILLYVNMWRRRQDFCQPWAATSRQQSLGSDRVYWLNRTLIETIKVVGGEYDVISSSRWQTAEETCFKNNCYFNSHSDGR